VAAQESTRGKLLVIEGAEGAGKSTLVRRIADELSRGGHPHLECREPGGTTLGDSIRELVLHRPAPMSPRAEAALFMTSRAELVATVVEPALSKGTIVTLDRFFLSTYAYQIHGRGLPEIEVRQANSFATGGLVPDLTVLLRVPFDEGLRRADGRGSRDRMESSSNDFHRRVQHAFDLFATAEWQRAHQECGPIVGVEGTGTEEAVWSRVLDVLTEKLPDTFALPARSRR
jgi:dTMP kinase